MGNGNGLQAYFHSSQLPPSTSNAKISMTRDHSPDISYLDISTGGDSDTDDDGDSIKISLMFKYLVLFSDSLYTI